MYWGGQETLKSYREIYLNYGRMVVQGLENHNIMLNDVSERLRNDYEIVKLAMSICYDNYQYIGEDFKYDLDVVATSQFAYNYGLMPDEFIKNKDVMITLVNSSRFMVFRLPKIWECDYDVAMAAVVIYGHYLRYVKGEMGNNKDVIKHALRHDMMSWFYVSSEMKADEEILELYNRLYG